MDIGRRLQWCQMWPRSDDARRTEQTMAEERITGTQSFDKDCYGYTIPEYIEILHILQVKKTIM